MVMLGSGKRVSRPHPRHVEQTSVPNFSWASRFKPVESLDKSWRNRSYVPVAMMARVVCDTTYSSLYIRKTRPVPDHKHYACVVDRDRQ